MKIEWLVTTNYCFDQRYTYLVLSQNISGNYPDVPCHSLWLCVTEIASSSCKLSILNIRFAQNVPKWCMNVTVTSMGISLCISCALHVRFGSHDMNLWFLSALFYGLFGHTRGVRFIWPSKCTIFIFSDSLLSILHAMYLISHKVASNQAKINVFLHISFNYLRTYHLSSPKFWPWGWKSLKYLPNRSEGVQCFSECQGFYTFFSFHALQNVSKLHSAS